MYAKVAAGVFSAFTIVIIVVLAFPQVAATSYSYFDINSGRVKVVCVSFGRIYRESIADTEYSKLLKQYGVHELPADWRLANSRELGLRRLLKTQHMHFKYSRLPADATMFAIWLQLEDKANEEEKRKRLDTFRTLVREGTPEQIHNYVRALVHTGATK